MAWRPFTLNCGTGTIAFGLPEEQVRCEVLGQPFPAVGLETAYRIFGVPIETTADIVIASAGGYPRDINLYQTGQTMDNAGYAMRPGGVAIILSERSQVRDPEPFFKWFGYPSNQGLDAALRECFHLDGWVAFKQLECNARGLFILVTRPENAEALKPTGFTVCAGIEEALSIACRKCGARTPRITVMPRASLTLPILPANHV